MAFVNGKDQSFAINSVDLSAFMNNVSFERSADSHDVTTFGASSHAYIAGLKDCKISIEGVYDDGETGPGATLRSLVGGAAQTFVYGPEGDATGKPTVSGSALVLGYTETVPVADVIKWAASLQVAGDLTDGTVAA